MHLIETKLYHVGNEIKAIFKRRVSAELAEENNLRFGNT
jgi:hypothetical protein